MFHWIVLNLHTWIRGNSLEWNISPLQCIPYHTAEQHFGSYPSCWAYWIPQLCWASQINNTEAGEVNHKRSEKAKSFTIQVPHMAELTKSSCGVSAPQLVSPIWSNGGHVGAGGAGKPGRSHMESSTQGAQCRTWRCLSFLWISILKTDWQSSVHTHWTQPDCQIQVHD